MNFKTFLLNESTADSKTYELDFIFDDERDDTLTSTGKAVKKEYPELFKSDVNVAISTLGKGNTVIRLSGNESKIKSFIKKGGYDSTNLDDFISSTKLEKQDTATILVYDKKVTHDSVDVAVDKFISKVKNRNTIVIATDVYDDGHYEFTIKGPKEILKQLKDLSAA